jgi:phosphoribosylglycinamide formyltransferase-1
MIKIALFASGSGSNFEAIAEFLNETDHGIACLICDNPDAYVLKRAEKYGIPAHVIDYTLHTKREAENKIIDILSSYGVEFIVLAGFMRILSEHILTAYPNRIINIHPSLLPKYPGVDSIRKSYYSNDKKLGITIHWVDKGIDTGPIILQKSFEREGGETLEEIEEQIHKLEHTYYPIVLKNILDGLERKKEETPRRKI